MICKNCGTDNPEQSIFCNHCGQLLTDQPVSQPEQVPAMPQSMQDMPEEVQLTMPEETEEPKRSPQPVIVAMLLLLAVIGLAAGVIYYMTRDKQSEESSHDSNPYPACCDNHCICDHHGNYHRNHRHHTAGGSHNRSRRNDCTDRHDGRTGPEYEACKDDCHRNQTGHRGHAAASGKSPAPVLCHRRLDHVSGRSGT